MCKRYVGGGGICLEYSNLTCFIIDENENYAYAIIESILEILKIKSSEKHKDVADGIDTIIPHFITKSVEASLDDSDNLILQPSIMEIVALIIITIFSKVDSR